MQETSPEDRRPSSSHPPFGKPFDTAAIADRMGNRGHSFWLDTHFYREGPDWIELTLPWRPELAANAETGIFASGPIISMMDNVTACSVWKKRGMFLPQVTVDLRVDYMRPASPGQTLIGRGECYKLTRSIAFVRGIAYEDSIDDPVAHVAGTFIIMGQAPS